MQFNKTGGDMIAPSQPTSGETNLRQTSPNLGARYSCRFGSVLEARPVHLRYLLITPARNEEAFIS
jgi:hypothetical protein